MWLVVISRYLKDYNSIFNSKLNNRQVKCEWHLFYSDWRLSYVIYLKYDLKNQKKIHTYVNHSVYNYNFTHLIIKLVLIGIIVTRIHIDYSDPSVGEISWSNKLQITLTRCEVLISSTNSCFVIKIGFW